ncbi:uncharacterized protein A4U43_C07F33470 [Asparagus officinalis]|uniref:Ammonium transporter AmtB-like domain-containing protein n=1 Tax=Asparagus officinalis TaxID=4686 RepID=A0A5P1EIR0_ASPOF|nr:uncharacterized protein A4U43_C07F33470 [Asparagus officinalis]
MGWTGFNGGGPYSVNVDASLAILNTHVCTATSLLVWLGLGLDILFFEKPSVIGAVQGMITGLVCITPAAGLVQGWAAIIMGVLSGSIPWYTMMVLHKKLRDGRTGEGFKQMGMQLAGIAFIVVINVIITSIVCNLIKLIVPLRLSEEDMNIGDDAIHGEEAYALWGDGEKFESSKHNSPYDVEEFPSAGKAVQMT